MSTSTVPTVALGDGETIPQLGFGVYQIRPEGTVEAVGEALRAGYRHIDTAQVYGNEREVGEAIRASGLAREDVFVTSKLWFASGGLYNRFHDPDIARRAFDGTLQRLGLEYVDLFLIHWPLPMRYGGDYVSTWRILEEFKNDARSRSIGVSNFHPEHLGRLLAETDAPPAVDQFESHPYLANDAVSAYCREHGIAVEAWSPIAQGAVLRDPTVSGIAERTGRTPAQVVLRWHVQRGNIVIPKSTTPSRIKENFALFDFELDTTDMEAIAALDRGERGRLGPNPDVFGYVPF